MEKGKWVGPKDVWRVLEKGQWKGPAVETCWYVAAGVRLGEKWGDETVKERRARFCSTAWALEGLQGGSQVYGETWAGPTETGLVKGL
jgi:hypothetical protein